jgi:hypothetical protein
MPFHYKYEVKSAGFDPSPPEKISTSVDELRGMKGAGEA